MELYVFNRDLEFKGIFENFFSLRWVRKYHKAGEFELHCGLTPESLNILKKDNIIYKKGDSEAGYIEYRNIKLDGEGKEILVIKGNFLTGYLNRRIVWNTMNLEGKAEEKMKELVDLQCINTDTDRIIDNLELSINKGFMEEINYQVSYKPVLNELEKISNITNLGYRINFNPSDEKLIFDVYKGLDRSVNQNENARCIFSQQFENIREQEYTDSDNNYKNVALVGGQGEGTNRTKITIGNSSGLDRYEIFVDAKDISKEKDDGTTITDIEYQNLLTERGNSKLAEYKRVETFDSKINVGGNLEYKTDFDLGDVITIMSKRWGIKLDTRITEIEEVYEEQGKQINVVFGNNIPTLTDKIKQKID